MSPYSIHATNVRSFDALLADGQLLSQILPPIGELGGAPGIPFLLNPVTVGWEKLWALSHPDRHGLWKERHVSATYFEFAAQHRERCLPVLLQVWTNRRLVLMPSGKGPVNLMVELVCALGRDLAEGFDDVLSCWLRQQKYGTVMAHLGKPNPSSAEEVLAIVRRVEAQGFDGCDIALFLQELVALAGRYRESLSRQFDGCNN